MHRIIDLLIPTGTKRRLFAKLAYTGVTRPKTLLAKLNWKNVRAFFHHLQTTDAVVLDHMLNRTLDITYPNVHRKLTVCVPDPGHIGLVEQKEGLSFSQSAYPAVSIIIPAYNQWRSTYTCLKSILDNTRDVSYEVIVADDCSTDETAEMLQKVNGITVIKNKSNLGFLKNCNNAAGYARGQYLLFLNNDTYVLEGWLRELLDCCEKDAKVGMAGPNLLSPDGNLLESGWIMGNDGWGQPLGRGGDPDDYRYNYLKEVDCVTGACLLVRKNLFVQAGLFDEAFSPAFYEEFDLAFTVRKMGYRVMVQPKSMVVHYNSVSYGEDNRNRYSVINRQKFMEKWDAVLRERAGQPLDNLLAKERSRGKRVVLFIDMRVPDYDRHAGSLSIYQYARLFLDLGFKVIFLPDDLTKSEPYATEMERRGIEVIYGAFDFNKWLRENGSYIDLAFISRPHISIKYIDRLKKHTNAKILYYMVDLHYLRLLRRYAVEKNRHILKESRKFKKIEFRLFNQSDAILTPSTYEAALLSKDFPGKVRSIPVYIYDEFLPEGSVSPFNLRKDIVFIGGFDHIPNVDAVIWFAKEIFPLIAAQLPGIKFIILGNNPPPNVSGLQSGNITVTGYVKDLLPYFKEARVFVAPLRYGAGAKGKIITSMYYGVPAVTTATGAEGLGIIDGEHALIADDPATFAAKVVELYTDRDLWTKLSAIGLNYVKEVFSRQAAEEKMLDILGLQRCNNCGSLIETGQSGDVDDRRGTVLCQRCEVR